MPCKNRDLLFWNQATPRTDQLYVVTEAPTVLISAQGARTTTVRVNLDACAAVLDSRADFYPGQPTVAQIRNGQEEGWLLSGGTLITDHRNYIAVGLRDGNAADRFMYTNIGAGRCDQRLQEHCYEERDSEFILCVKEGGAWHQVIFGLHTIPLHRLKKPDVDAVVAPILPNLGEVAPPQTTDKPLASALAGEIVVEWYDEKGISLSENLSGYVFVDNAVHTTEFRFGLQYDLSAYEDVRIFYGEGTGYAEWQSLDQIRFQARARDNANREMITAFLRHL
jgi:hypothetical protein